jgi:hypothetical protein
VEEEQGHGQGPTCQSVRNERSCWFRRGGPTREPPKGHAEQLTKLGPSTNAHSARAPDGWLKGNVGEADLKF